jgi:MoxR-like ATPase
MGYPSEGEELAMMQDRRLGDPLDQVEPIADAAQIGRWQQQVRAIEVRPSVARYLLSLVLATRGHPDLQIGISPRGALGLYRAAQARALLACRSYVSPADVLALAVAALAHRVVPTQRARYGGTSPAAIIEAIVGTIAVPT